MLTITFKGDMCCDRKIEAPLVGCSTFEELSSISWIMIHLWIPSSYDDSTFHHPSTTISPLGAHPGGASCHQLKSWTSRRWLRHRQLQSSSVPVTFNNFQDSFILLAGRAMCSGMSVRRLRPAALSTVIVEPRFVWNVNPLVGKR